MKIDQEKLVDYSTRFKSLATLMSEMNLSSGDQTILFFAIMGVPDPDAKISDILKKITLPVHPMKADPEKINMWRDLIVERMRELDNYGILDLEQQDVVKHSRNGKYLTLLGMKIIPMTYWEFYRILMKNPEYAVSVLAGIRDALDVILEFLEAGP